MAHYYTLSTFLRQTPNRTLAEYFHKRDLLTAFDFTALTPAEFPPILAQMEDLTYEQRETVSRDFQEIFMLANAAGAVIMRDVSGSAGLDVADDLEAKENHYDRAMWLFLNHNDGPGSPFFFCTRLAHLRDLPFSRAKQRKDLPRRVPRSDTDACVEMAAGLQQFYRGQGRGHKCIVEHYLRADPDRHCYFAFPEDYTTSELEYDGDKLLPHSRKSVLEVGFIYRPDEGLLEIGASGGKTEIQALQRIFCRAALGMEELPPPRNDEVYKLDGLLRRNFAFPTDPEDGIEGVKLTSLRLLRIGSRARKITIEQSADAQEHLLDWLDEVLDQERAPARHWQVEQARFRATWRATAGKPPKTLTFTLTRPDSTSLKDLPNHRVIKSYLKRWRLM